MMIATKSINLLEVKMVVLRDDQLPRIARSSGPPHGGIEEPDAKRPTYAATEGE